MNSIERGIKIRQDEKAKEVWTGISPPAEQCKKCIYAYEDVKINKDAVIYGATNANCEIYSPPDDKPTDVLWEDEPCEFFEEKE